MRTEEKKTERRIPSFLVSDFFPPESGLSAHLCTLYEVFQLRPAPLAINISSPTIGQQLPNNGRVVGRPDPR